MILENKQAEPNLNLYQQAGALQQAGGAAEEGGGGRAGADAVVEGQAERRDPGADDALLLEGGHVAHPADAEDGGLRRVDDRREGVDARRLQGRDGERAPREVGGRQLAGPRLLDELVDGRGNVLQRPRVGAAHHRHHEPLVEVDCNADIDLRQHEDLVGFQAGVEARVLAQGQGDRPHDQRRQRDDGAVAAPLAVEAADHLHGVVHRRLADQCELGHAPQALQHAFADRAAPAGVGEGGGADRLGPRGGRGGGGGGAGGGGGGGGAPRARSPPRPGGGGGGGGGGEVWVPPPRRPPAARP